MPVERARAATSLQLSRAVEFSSFVLYLVVVVVVVVVVVIVFALFVRVYVYLRCLQRYAAWCKHRASPVNTNR